MTHTLTAKEQSLAKIFSDDYVFTIPGYQRPYAWGGEQTQELLDDLLSALAAAPNQLGDAAPYFLGSIVLIKSEASPDATVVDGQQRLTTLTLLLSVIRALVADINLQKDITGCVYEKGNLVKGTSARYRLSLRERDCAFFRKYVQHEDGVQELMGLNTTLPDAQARLQKNAGILFDGLEHKGQDELVRLVQFIITRCYLVTVATPDLDSAYRIFGVLNSRGLDLSATDILKADIIGGIEPTLRDTYTKKWEDEEEDIGRDEFGELFSHIRMVYRKAKPQGTLLKEFKEHVTSVRQPKEFVDKTLMPMAEAFADLQGADYASQLHAEEINECISWLNKLEFKDWLPPALTFFVKYRQQPVSVLSFFRDLERLGYSMLARKIGVNERIERFSALTNAIENGADLYSKASPLQLSPEEQYQTYDALNGPLYETHSPRALALLLLRLDNLLSDGSASYKHEVVSVEHVMPQQPAPNSQWATWVPDSTSRQLWVHRLGNLALLSRKKNSSASNRDFDWKKKVYFTKGGTTAFVLTTDVLSHNDWTIPVMQQRQEAMLESLEDHWRLQDREAKTAQIDAALVKLAMAGTEVPFELKSARHTLTAEAVEKGSSFNVMKGSQARLDWSGKPHSYLQLRENLVAAGTLAPSEDGKRLVFTRDFEFASPSAASAVVLGRTDNGRNTWRLKGTSITYGAWQDNLPASQPSTGQAET